RQAGEVRLRQIGFDLDRLHQFAGSVAGSERDGNQVDVLGLGVGVELEAVVLALDRQNLERLARLDDELLGDLLPRFEDAQEERAGRDREGGRDASLDRHADVLQAGVVGDERELVFEITFGSAVLEANEHVVVDATAAASLFIQFDFQVRIGAADVEDLPGIAAGIRERDALLGRRAAVDLAEVDGAGIKDNI